MRTVFLIVAPTFNNSVVFRQRSQKRQSSAPCFSSSFHSKETYVSEKSPAKRIFQWFRETSLGKLMGMTAAGVLTIASFNAIGTAWNADANRTKAAMTAVETDLTQASSADQKMDVIRQALADDGEIQEWAFQQIPKLEEDRDQVDMILEALTMYPDETSEKERIPQLLSGIDDVRLQKKSRTLLDNTRFILNHKGFWQYEIEVKKATETCKELQAELMDFVSPQ